MKTLLCCLVVLALSSCTEPKSGDKPDTSSQSKGSISNSVMTPVTAPIQARKHLRQQVRIINHQNQLRNQKIQGIQGQGQPGR